MIDVKLRIKTPSKAAGLQLINITSRPPHERALHSKGREQTYSYSDITDLTPELTSMKTLQRPLTANNRAVTFTHRIFETLIVHGEIRLMKR